MHYWPRFRYIIYVVCFSSLLMQLFSFSLSLFVHHSFILVLFSNFYTRRHREYHPSLPFHNVIALSLLLVAAAFLSSTIFHRVVISVYMRPRGVREGKGKIPRETIDHWIYGWGREIYRRRERTRCRYAICVSPPSVPYCHFTSLCPWGAKCLLRSIPCIIEIMTRDQWENCVYDCFLQILFNEYSRYIEYSIVFELALLMLKLCQRERSYAI